MTDNPRSALLAVLEQFSASGSAARVARKLAGQLSGPSDVCELTLVACQKAARRGAAQRELTAQLCRVLVSQIQLPALDELLARLTRDPLPEVWVPAARAFGEYAVRQGRNDWIVTGGPGGSMQDTFRRRVYPALASAARAGWQGAVRWLEQGLHRSGDVWDRASVLLGMEELVSSHPSLVNDWLTLAARSKHRVLRWQLSSILPRLARMLPSLPAERSDALRAGLLGALESLRQQTLLLPSDLTNHAFEMELRESLARLAGLLSSQEAAAAELLDGMADPQAYGVWGAREACRALGRPAAPDWDLSLGEPAARVARADALCLAIRRAREANDIGSLPEGWPQGLATGGPALEAAAVEAAQALCSVPGWIAAAATLNRELLEGEAEAVYATVRAYEEVLAGAGREVERLLAVLRGELTGALANTFNQLAAQIARERLAAAQQWIEAVLPLGNYWLTLRLLDWIHRSPELEPQRVFEQFRSHWKQLPGSLFARRIPALLGDLHGRYPDDRRSDWLTLVRSLAEQTRGPEVLARAEAWAGEPITDASCVTPLEGPGQIGRYRIIEKIGQGGFGEVYRAVHPVLGIDVAIKIPRSDILEQVDLDAFMREARLLAELTARGGARYVLRIYDADHTYAGSTKLTYVVMEYVAEGSLLDLLEKEGKQPPELAAEILRQSALGIEAAHRLEPAVIHRDVKPGNLLLKQTPFGLLVRVADFGGAARARDENAHILCSIGYTAPEVFAGVIAPSIDIFALGAVLYDCLAGQPPYPKTSVGEYMDSVTSSPPTPLLEVEPDLPRELVEIVEKAMARDPAERYVTAQGMAEALGQFVAQDGATRQL
ncbi:serine/threonine protein kinase [bacterium AH-315-M10]|nr:serine/threonine protein kinase [bacterium AH-315-M10]